MLRLIAVLLSLMTIAACGDGAVTAAGEWTELRRAPIPERASAEVAVVGNEVFVFGGSDDYCPPSADCAQPDWPPFSDGAAFDVETATWRAIADTPVGIEHASTITVGTDLYVAWLCFQNGRCPTGSGMLRYSTTDDAWDRLAAIPADRGWYELVAVDASIFAVAGSTEFADTGDWMYDDEADSWTRLPDPPTGKGHDRFGLSIDGSLHLFASTEPPANTKTVARFDSGDGTWTQLTPSPESGFQAWLVGDRVYLNPHFGDARGGVYMPASDTWNPLPERPDGAGSRDLAGVVAADRAVYDASHGWALDAVGEEWMRIPRRDELAPLSGESVLAVGGNLFVYGGLSFTDDERPIWGRAWLWTR